MIRTKQKAPVKSRDKPDDQFNEQSLPGLNEQSFVDMYAVIGPEKLKLLPKKRGRPPSGKVMINLRLDPDVLAKFRATGKGWQARINDILKAAKL